MLSLLLEEILTLKGYRLQRQPERTLGCFFFYTDECMDKEVMVYT